jgi:hypothetical protein
VKAIKKNPLFFAFFFPALVDGVVTLVGQGPEYWSNRIVNEASPAYYFLYYSPWLFILGSVVWFMFWYWAIKKLKEPLNLFLMFLFIAGHSWGSSSWIWYLLEKYNFYSALDQSSVIFAWCIAIVYFMLIALFATYSLRIYFGKRGKLS